MLQSTKINGVTTLHDGRVFKLVKEHITLPTGVTTDLDIVRHPGASAMVPLPKMDRVILIRQYRHAVGDLIWEIPAGTFGEHETPIECAKRELLEEIGFAAKTWHKLGEITPVPGYSDERIHLFLAADLAPAHQDLDEDEILEVHEKNLAEALQMIFQGRIQDAKTIAALFMANQWVQENG